ncbi:hypothetical protein D9M71_664890 [compost metagenome]
MDGSRHQFLAGTRLAADEDVDRVVKHLGDQSVHGTHGGTAADKAVAFQGIGLDAFRQLRIRWGEASEQAHLGNDDAPEVPERNV